MGRIMAGKASDMPPGTIHKATLGGRDVLIANIDGSYYATDDTCTHAGASLSEGTLRDSVIVCGWHGAEFDCKSGKLSKFPAKIGDLGSYAVTVENGDVFVEV